MKVPIIQLRHLKYRYTDSHPLAINDVNLNVYRGEWLSLIGLNGSGKSTLVKLIDGLLTNFSGQIVVGHRRLTEETLLAIRSKIGIVFQNPADQFVGATVKDEVAFGLENHRVPADQIMVRVDRALSLVGMRTYQDSLVDNLSGGQQQRVAIADVIVMRPKVMILDECTSMLDPQGRIRIMRLIRALKRRFGLTVIDITHDISETKYAQRIAVMDHGKIIINGSPDDVFSRDDLLKRYHLGLPAPDVLRDQLRNDQVRVPDRHFSESGMLTWLRKLFLNT